MKSRFLTLILLLACLSSLFAVSVTHLHMSTGNDWYTMGLGDNLDDGLSFGGHLMVAFDDSLFFKVDALGFTDRIDTLHRYDQINMNLSSPLALPWGPFITVVTPLVGVSLEGDFGFNRVQNKTHQIINRPRIYLPYDSTEPNAHLNLGATIQALYPLGWIRIGLEASYLHTFGWENSIQTVGVIKLGSSLMLKGGYSSMHDFGGGPSHQIMMDRLSGPTFSYYFDGGLITNSWIYHMNSKSSYGVFGIDLMQIFQPVTYDHTDFTYSLGVFYDMVGHQNRSFSLAFGPIIMQTRHKSGPMKNDLIHSSKRMTVASWMVGYQKEWEATDLIYPYLKTLWGFQRFNLQYSPTTVMIETIKGTVALETGIRFGKEGQWVAKNNSYRPRLSASIQYVFDTKDIEHVDSAFDRHLGPWIFLIGIGLDIGHDPH
ncbi:MAG TPA: hypothetical protein VJ854_03665 [Sphaerochaeta sp.]|nr:hypothetical protein [Sphaerochaeta sp.]